MVDADSKMLILRVESLPGLAARPSLRIAMGGNRQKPVN
jgi:hypothetical protein